ncbi:hypothetical protein AALO_G00120950 [Alosa alosa]|uniref:Uncharacterized protein n=1 Tax=Alosa alosa TaxID=278164 RepID=A0AAV6GJY2_9TELE|nr:hypothetical protein AALO_G00120950 [Alosa alosa]
MREQNHETAQLKSSDLPTIPCCLFSLSIVKGRPSCAVPRKEFNLSNADGQHLRGEKSEEPRRLKNNIHQIPPRLRSHCCHRPQVFFSETVCSKAEAITLFPFFSFGGSEVRFLLHLS